MKRTLLLTPLLLLAACGGGETTLCEEASRHIAACLGNDSSDAASTTCQGRDVALATELLALDCSGLQSLLANTGTLGKADENACLAPWDCPEQYPPTGDGCSMTDMARCQGHCDELYASDNLRLRKVSCEMLEGGIAHCECQGYWLPWPESQPEEEEPDEEPPPEEDPFWS